MLTLVFHVLRFIRCVVLVVARLSTWGYGSLNHVPSDRILTADCDEMWGRGAEERNTILSVVKSGENYSQFIIPQQYIYIYIYIVLNT